MPTYAGEGNVGVNGAVVVAGSLVLKWAGLSGRTDRWEIKSLLGAQSVLTTHDTWWGGRGLRPSDCWPLTSGQTHPCRKDKTLSS